MNRTIVELVCAMINMQNLPEFLWEPAMAHAAYIQNRSYTWALTSATPYEIMHGMRVNVTVTPQGLPYVPRVYLYLYSAIYVSCLLMCITGPPYRSYWTSPLPRYLAALDLLTRHGSPAYLGHTSHARTASSTHTYLYCFWHAWVISTAMTPISFAAYSVQYCASVSPFTASWRIFSACYDSYFPWLLVTRSTCIYSVCTDSSRFRLGLLCNPRTINHLLSFALSSSSVLPLQSSLTL